MMGVERWSQAVQLSLLFIFISCYKALDECAELSFEKHVAFTPKNDTTQTIWPIVVYDLKDILSIMSIILTAGFMDQPSRIIAIPTCGVFLYGSLLSISEADGVNRVGCIVSGGILGSICGGQYLVILLILQQLLRDIEKADRTIMIARILGVVSLGHTVGCAITIIYNYSRGQANLHALITITVMCFMMLIVSVCYFASSFSRLTPIKSGWFGCTSWRTIVDKHTLRECSYILLISISIALYVSCDHSSIILIRAVSSHIFKWSHRNNTWFLIASYASSGLSLLILLPLVLTKIQFSMLTLSMLALAAKVMSSALSGFAVESWMLYINVIVYIISAPFTTCQIVLILQITKPVTQSYVLALVFSGLILFEYIAPTLTLELYALSHEFLEGLALIVIAVILVVVFMICLWLSADFQNYEHQNLLDDLREEEEMIEQEVGAEDWLLDITSSQEHDGNDVVQCENMAIGRERYREGIETSHC